VSSNRLQQAVDEVINQGHMEQVEELFHPAFRDLDVYLGEAEGTRESLKAFFVELRTALPDLRFERLEAEAVVGDQIWGRYMASGTMTGGPLFGKPPTGRFARWREIHWVRVDAATGQIIEHFGAGDDLGMLQQLGLLDPLLPASPSEAEHSPGVS
jgi:predicted ester cyclase